MATEKVVVEVEVKAQPAVASVKSLKAELRQVTNELSNLEEGSDAFVKAAQKAGDLKDQISDVKNVVNAFNPEAKFKALGDAVGIAANGFAAVQGAMALMGSESEDLNKVIAKTQGAIALATGLNGLLGMKDAFGVLKLTSIASFNAIRASAIATFSTLKGAMAATGIGALVVALGYLVAKYFETSAANEEATKKEKEYTEQTKKTKEATDEKVKSIELEIIAIQNKTNAAGASLINAKAEKAVLEEQIAAAKLHNEELIKTGNERFNNGKSALFEVDALEKNLKTKNDEIVSLEKIAEKVNELDKVKTDADNKEKARLKLIADNLAKKNAIENAAIDKRNQDRKDEQLLKNKEQDDIAKKIDLDNKTEEENDKKALDKHIVSLKEISTNDRLSYDERLAAYRQMAAEQIITATQLKDAEVAIEKEKQAAKTAALQEGANVLNQASELLGKNTAEGKMLAVASATISTYLSAQKAFESFAAIPVYGVGLGIAAAAVAVASGIASVNKILSVEVPGQGGGGGGVAPTAPRIPQSISGTMMNQNKPLDMNNVNNPTGKVIVVETDITNTQNKVKGIIRKATIK
jgi:hypothetical protein